MKRLEIAQYIALGATCMTVLGFVINLATQSRWSITMCGYGVMIGLISYFFGGIKTAVKMAGKIAKWGWMHFFQQFHFFAFERETLPEADR